MSKYIYLITFILTGNVLNSYSQVDSLEILNPSVLNCTELKPGLYESFDNFRRNEPYYTDDFKIYKVDYNKLVHGADYEPFVVHSFEESINGLIHIIKNGPSPQPSTAKEYKDQVGLKKRNKAGNWVVKNANKFFGYCDGDSIYISFWKFHPIVELGHLSLIKVEEIRKRYENNYRAPMGTQPFNQPGMNRNHWNRGPSFQADPPIAMESKFDQINKWYVLDFMTGNLQELTMATLREKFTSWDQELLVEFENHQQKNLGYRQVEFVKKFNQRHPIRF